LFGKCLVLFGLFHLGWYFFIFFPFGWYLFDLFPLGWYLFGLFPLGWYLFGLFPLGWNLLCLSLSCLVNVSSFFPLFGLSVLFLLLVWPSFLSLV